MTLSPIILIIADAHIITRNGLAKTIEAATGIEITASTNNSEDLAGLCNLHQPDVVMVGTSMPGANNLEAGRCLAAEFPHIAVIIIIDHNDAETVVAMKTAEEFAWLYKSATEEEIINTIQAVHEGTHKNMTYNGVCVNAVTTPLPQLTPREKQILSLLCLDLTAKEIAAKENISTRTVEKHKGNIMQKLQVKGVAALVLYALKNNISIINLVYSGILLLSINVPDIIGADAAL